jgi:hypothetical protein
VSARRVAFGVALVLLAAGGYRAGVRRGGRDEDRCETCERRR